MIRERQEGSVKEFSIVFPVWVCLLGFCLGVAYFETHVNPHPTSGARRCPLSPPRNRPLGTAQLHLGTPHGNMQPKRVLLSHSASNMQKQTQWITRIAVARKVERMKINLTLRTPEPTAPWGQAPQPKPW